MLKLGGLIVAVALVAAALWLAMRPKAEPPGRTPSQQEEVERAPQRVRPGLPTAEVQRPTINPPAAAAIPEEVAPAAEAAPAGGSAVPPLVMPPPEPAPTRFW